MKNLFIALFAVWLTGCGGTIQTDNDNPSEEGNSENNINPIEVNLPHLTCTEQKGNGSLEILGKVTYERINPQHNGNSTILNTSNITEELAKDILVTAIDKNENFIASTCTDAKGEYTLKGIPESTSLKIRVYAQLKNSTWDVKVVDNTHSDALYAIEGSLINSGTANSRRNLKAPYSTDAASPFAILDSIHQAMEKILTANTKSHFPTLQINWSVNNKATGRFKPKTGELPTTFYGDSNIYVLGDKASDADEFDNHIIIHEWGHYFEDMFSRADSIGGSHGSGQKLDIRVAFGEGWGNAFSAIATDDPLYYDTFNHGRQGSNMNIESAPQETPGYYSEASIQRILYDLYDSHDDGSDNLSMGFTPIYKTLVGAEKTTPAFTSIFTFITALKDENSEVSAKIDALTNSENIADISDIYGKSNDITLYETLMVGSSINITTDTKNGIRNKLGNHKYIRFTVNSARSYRIRVDTISSNTPDPDFLLFKTSPFKGVLQGFNTAKNEIQDINLEPGDYLLDIYDANFLNRADFTVSIN